MERVFPSNNFINLLQALTLEEFLFQNRSIREKHKEKRKLFLRVGNEIEVRNIVLQGDDPRRVGKSKTLCADGYRVGLPSAKPAGLIPSQAPGLHP